MVISADAEANVEVETEVVNETLWGPRFLMSSSNRPCRSVSASSETTPPISATIRRLPTTNVGRSDGGHSTPRNVDQQGGCSPRKLNPGETAATRFWAGHTTQLESSKSAPHSAMGI